MTLSSHLSFDKVIFDLDGTLLDYEGASHEALKSICQQYNKIFTMEMHASIIGTKNEDWSRKIVQQLEISHLVSPETIVHEYHVMMENFFPNMQLMDGAEKLMRRLKNHNIPMAIATSSTMAMVDKKLKHHPVFSECIDVIVTGDDPAVIRGKPEPDIFLEAARRLGGGPCDRFVVFEDSPYGIIGAHKAGMQSVAVPDKRFTPFMNETNCKIFRNLSTLVLTTSLDEFVF